MTTVEIVIGLLSATCLGLGLSVWVLYSDIDMLRLRLGVLEEEKEGLVRTHTYWRERSIELERRLVNLKHWLRDGCDDEELRKIILDAVLGSEENDRMSKLTEVD